MPCTTYAWKSTSAAVCAAALNDYATHWSGRTDVDLEMELPDQGLRLPLPIERELLRIAQEALANVARHSGADHCQLLWRHDDGRTHLEISDDGRGFRGEAIPAPAISD